MSGRRTYVLVSTGAQVAKSRGTFWVPTDRPGLLTKVYFSVAMEKLRRIRPARHRGRDGGPKFDVVVGHQLRGDLWSMGIRTLDERNEPPSRTWTARGVISMALSGLYGVATGSRALLQSVATVSE